MKITLNIDDALLERVKESTGASTKTEAIHIALREMDRRRRLIEFLNSSAAVFTNEELATGFDYAETEETARVAETIPTTYGSKPDSSR